ncbi:Oxidoreductase [Salinisphaera sp. LB1]|nr:Oxidoreductase [Salinisphaera sp. LB1]
MGTPLVRHLSGQGVDIHVLTRKPDDAELPEGVTAVAGDLLNIEAMRRALQPVSTLFLLVPVTPHELTQTLLMLNLAKEAGIERVVYLSVYGVREYTNVPHCAAKHAAELMIEQLGIPATILRPNSFMQNDLMIRGAIQRAGLYAFPIGSKGVSSIDVRDIAEVAATAILRRERSAGPLPTEIINLVGPDVLTGKASAAIWSNALKRPITYGGDDTLAFERQVAKHVPDWNAMDLRLMLDRFQKDGLRASAADVDIMTSLLGKTPRRYADFVAETCVNW